MSWVSRAAASPDCLVRCIQCMSKEAYLAASRGAEAAAEFQKVTDHRTITVSDPISVLARLQLARAYAISGDVTKAKAIYGDFLRSWKDADSEEPVPRQAKVEYAKLQ